MLGGFERDDGLFVLTAWLRGIELGLADVWIRIDINERTAGLDLSVPSGRESELPEGWRPRVGAEVLRRVRVQEDFYDSPNGELSLTGKDECPCRKRQQRRK